MQLSTKKCLLAYSGAIMFTFGFAIMFLGVNYYTTSTTLELAPLIVRAIPHWCGMLLILLGARNFTFGLAQWKYGMNCCGSGTCEVIFVNFLSLLASLAAIVMPIYSSWNYLNGLEAASIANSSIAAAELIHLISIWFMGLVTAILSLLSIGAGCLPIGSREGDEGMEDF